MFEDYEDYRVGALTVNDLIVLLGQIFRVIQVGPARRGGDFYDLVAVQWDGKHVGGTVAICVDRNQRVACSPARRSTCAVKYNAQ